MTNEDRVSRRQMLGVMGVAGFAGAPLMPALARGSTDEAEPDGKAGLATPNTFTQANEFEDNLVHTGSKVGLFGGVPSVRVPFPVNPEVDGAAAVASGGSEGIAPMVLAPKLKGDFSGIAGADAGFGWGCNGFALTDEDLRGLPTITGWLFELALQQNHTVNTVTGVQSDLAWFGAGARGTVTTAMTHRISAPRRKNGATDGNFETSYCLFIEDVGSANADQPGTVTGGAFSLYVDGGVSRFGGRVDVNNQVFNNGGSDFDLFAGFGETDGQLRLVPGADNGDVQARLRHTDAEFQVHDGSAAVWSVARTGIQKIIAANTQTTVGAAGAASALPATPSGYEKKTINGVACVTPYYVAA